MSDSSADKLISRFLNIALVLGVWVIAGFLIYSWTGGRADRHGQASAVAASGEGDFALDISSGSPSISIIGGKTLRFDGHLTRRQERDQIFAADAEMRAKAQAERWRTVCLDDKDGYAKQPTDHLRAFMVEACTHAGIPY
jgi:hypothetical protein